jgi:hypothetical protein
MEKKQTHNITTNTTTAPPTKPLGGMCERLFNVLNTNNTFRPLRRLTIRQQETEPQSEAQSNNFPATAATDTKHKIPSPPAEEKPAVTFTTPSVAKNDLKGTDKNDTPFVTKKDSKSTEQNTIPLPVPPKGAIMPQPVPPTGVALTDTTNTKPKKSLNEKVEDYIHRTKGKLRTGSTLGRTPSTK